MWPAEMRGARVLELGCGTGATIRLLRERGLCAWAAGIETHGEAADAARGSLDHLVVGDVERCELGLTPGSIDVLLCLDVIEHLVDPWAALARLSRLVRPGGAVIASIPNLRFYKVVLPLVLSGRWTYRDDGIMDRTHLRFFTWETIEHLMRSAGLTIDAVAPDGLDGKRNRQFWNMVTFGRFRDLFIYRYILRARSPAR
ncbi:MAG: class I SAM-dependent methyltransferase [Alphaproteobacteria bacterium]|nr:class I SAM-dependent methyltransferase [Alphaproteobacteria bacterium]